MLNLPKPSRYVAVAEYNCDAYGSSNYGSCPATATTSPSITAPPTVSNPSGGLLANTGYDVIIPVALGLAVLVASVLLLIRQLRRKSKSV